MALPNDTTATRYTLPQDNTVDYFDSWLIIDKNSQITQKKSNFKGKSQIQKKIAKIRAKILKF